MKAIVKIETNLVLTSDSFERDAERVFSSSTNPSHRPRKKSAIMACMAINYNVMVSLDISVGNPTWPNLDVLTYVRVRVCSSLRREHIGAKETTAASVYSAAYSPAGTYLRSRGRSENNNANCVHATVPPHPLSSNVSFFP